MTAISTRTDRADSGSQPRFGWLLSAAGLLCVSWWLWTWSKVDGLIDNHVAAEGTLPSSLDERAALYTRGTPGQRQLSSDLEAIPGLYPWGRLPLVLGASLVLAGWMFTGPRTPRRSIIGVGVAVLLLALPLVLFGDSMRIALDVLE